MYSRGYALLGSTVKRSQQPVATKDSNLCVLIYYRAVFMEFYGRNDITLGGFLEIYCFRYCFICNVFFNASVKGIRTTMPDFVTC